MVFFLENFIENEIPNIVNKIITNVNNLNNGPPPEKKIMFVDEENPTIINIDSEIQINPKLNIDVIFKIIDRKYIFDPSKYYQDSYYRIIYVPDFSIKLRLDIDFIYIDCKFLNYILSLAQLLTLELISSENFEAIVTAVVRALDLRISYKYKYKRLWFQKSLNGKVIEEVNMILTSKEFETYHSSFVSGAKLSIRYASEKSIGNKDLGGSRMNQF